MQSSLAINGIPLTLPIGRIFETADVDFARESISAVLQPHTLVPQRQLSARRCRLDLIRVNRVGIGSIRFGKMQVHVPAFGDYFLFIACLSGNATLQINREEHRIDQSRGVFLMPGDEMLGDFSEECTQIFVRFDGAAFADHAALNGIHFNRAVNLSAPALGPWTRQVTTLASDPETARLATMIPGLGLTYERLLVGLLLAGQPHEIVKNGASAVSPGCVKRAEAFIHDRYAEALTLADIARSAGVPIRTLQDNFQRFNALSPGRYLKNVRLDAAHRAMRGGLVATATEAAMDAGLFHLGRFSQDYLQRFGEKPSDTLRTTRTRSVN